MCGRYEVSPFLEKSPLYADLWEMPLTERLRKETKFVSSGVMVPGCSTAALALSRKREKKLFPMKWGYQLRSDSHLINARTESAAQLPTFRESWRSHRCLLPASAYFEWEHKTTPFGGTQTGTRYRIAPKTEQLTWLCGLYRMEQGVPVFVILTRAPWEGIAFIHNRMPLILPESAVDAWIDPSVPAEELLSLALEEMDYAADEV